jgi:hypothetical protein
LARAKSAILNTGTRRGAHLALGWPLLDALARRCFLPVRKVLKAGSLNVESKSGTNAHVWAGLVGN